MLKIIGRKTSSNVQKVLWACAEMGVKFERQDAGMQFGVTNTPEYIAMNPNKHASVFGHVLYHQIGQDRGHRSARRSGASAPA